MASNNIYFIYSLEWYRFYRTDIYSISLMFLIFCEQFSLASLAYILQFSPEELSVRHERIWIFLKVPFEINVWQKHRMEL